MQQQLHQLESEIARLQVELRQVRQMIGSLIRHESNTTQMMNNHMIRQQGNSIAGNMAHEQRQEMGQYEQMRRMADQMNQQLGRFDSFSGRSHTATEYRGDLMNPRYNDPVQNQY